MAALPCHGCGGNWVSAPEFCWGRRSCQAGALRGRFSRAECLTRVDLSHRTVTTYLNASRDRLLCEGKTNDLVDLCKPLSYGQEGVDGR